LRSERASAEQVARRRTISGCSILLRCRRCLRPSTCTDGHAQLEKPPLERQKQARGGSLSGAPRMMMTFVCCRGREGRRGPRDQQPQQLPRPGACGSSPQHSCPPQPPRPGCNGCCACLHARRRHVGDKQCGCPSLFTRAPFGFLSLYCTPCILLRVASQFANVRSTVRAFARSVGLLRRSTSLGSCIAFSHSPVSYSLKTTPGLVA